MAYNRDRECGILLGIFVIALGISAIKPYENDYFNWLLEVAPALIGVGALIVTYRKFPMTRMVYWFVLFHTFILMYGGHYTYAKTPLGESMKDWFGFTRNNYDKIGHFAFGFFPVVIISEVIMRTSSLKKGKWLFFLSVCVIGAAAAFYEFIEWWAAALSDPAAGDAFLGTQGYVWDTQTDMFFAFVGAIIAYPVFKNWHIRQMKSQGLFPARKKSDGE